ARRLDVVAGIAELFAEQVAHRGVVLDDQDRPGAGHARSLALPTMARAVTRQPVPGCRLRLGVDRRRALCVGRALLDAEVLSEVRRAHVAAAERGAIAVAGARARAHVAAVGVCDEQEARTRQSGRAVGDAIAGRQL